MGEQVKAKCECGLTAEILTGGGMLNHLTVDYFPFFCNSCDDVVQGNLKDKTPSCPNCHSFQILSYKNADLRENSRKNIISDQFSNELTEGYYTCPRCNKMQLQFFPGNILWD